MSEYIVYVDNKNIDGRGVDSNVCFFSHKVLNNKDLATIGNDYLAYIIEQYRLMETEKSKDYRTLKTWPNGLYYIYVLYPFVIDQKGRYYFTCYFT